jgi:Zn finger protein HypA/HybF involved in hydrogenase expression
MNCYCNNCDEYFYEDELIYTTQNVCPLCESPDWEYYSRALLDNSKNRVAILKFFNS